MRVITRLMKPASVAVALAAVALAGTGCSSSTKSTSASTAAAASGSAEPTMSLPTTVIPPQAPVAAIVAMVPASIKSTGSLTVAAASYPPDEFLAPGTSTLVGMDPDLATAIAQTMGLKPKFVHAVFATILPGVIAGTYDMGASSISDTLARQQTVDFVTYYSAGEQFFVKTDGTMARSGLVSPCGHSIAVMGGTIQEAAAKVQATQCVAGGKATVTIHTFATQAQANTALADGVAEVGFTDSPAVAYTVSTSHGVFQTYGEPFNAAPYGLALGKGNGMTAPVQAALNALIADGVYGQILTKWGLQAGAVQTASINGAIH